MKYLFSLFFRFFLLVVLVGFLPRTGYGVGETNPTGVAGDYNGEVTTGGGYDPLTGNAKRRIEDIGTVEGSIGAYPLKWTRTLSSRSPGNWLFSYRWALWVRLPGAPIGPSTCPNCIEGGYEGPEGLISMPDGGSLDLVESGTGHYFTPWANPRKSGFIEVVNVGPGAYDARLSDGGIVHFTGAASNYVVIAVARTITDPYGQVTTLDYDSSDRLARVTEPGGRYLQINRTSTGAISSVHAFDGRGTLTQTVTYIYTTLNLPYSYGPAAYLTQVDYDDGTHAYYTYQSGNQASQQGVTPGIIKTCDDVRYAGPMKQIEYEFATGNNNPQFAWGQIKAERNFTTHQVVSQVTYPSYPGVTPPTDPGQFRRTETRGDGATRTFQYGNYAGYLTEYTDFQGHSSHLENDVVFTDARGNTTRTPYNGAGKITSVTHPDGSGASYQYLNSIYLISSTNERGAYDGDPAYTTFHDRDGNNRIWQTRYPDGATERFTYNEFGQVLTHKMTSGGTETFEYDYRGRKTAYFPPATCDANVCSDSNPSAHKTIYNYYESGPHTDRLLNVVDSFGNATWYEYNGRGQVTKLMHQDGTYTESAYNPDGTLAWTSDELRHPTSYTYDEYKRVLTVTNARNKTTTTSYALDPDWATASAKPFLHTTNSAKYIITPSGKNTVFDYDANFRKIDQVAALGTAEEAWTLFEYDEVGNLTKTTDPLWNVTRFGYDNRNRQTTVTDATNHTTTTDYDVVGNKTKITRLDGQVVQYPDYDSMNRLTRQIDENNVTTTMGYDLAGNLAWNKDGNGHQYSYSYDKLNRRTVMTYPNQATERYQYDIAGNLKTYTNRAGNIQTFFYDNRNRQYWFDWSDGLTPQQSTTYDAASRVTQIWNWNATINNLYFEDNTLQSQEEWIANYGDNVHRTVSYLYDADGNRSKITYPSGKNYYYGYTPRNQLWWITRDAPLGQPNGFVETAFVYDKAGNMTTRYVGNNWVVTDASQRDSLNRVTHLEHQLVGTTRRLDYQFNLMSNRTSIQRDGGVQEGQIYDPTQQLTQTVANGSTVTMKYDNNGNRISPNGGGGYESNNMNQYTLFNNVTPHYDSKGNLDAYNGWTYSYDAQNRLKTVKQGATLVEEFWYDGLNRQITRNLNGAVTFNVYDSCNLIEEYAGPFAPSAPPSPTPAPTPVPQVALPTYNPDGGEYPGSSTVAVTITTATAGANLRYTLDGTTPTQSYGTLIAASSGTVTVTSATGTTVLKAIAFKSGWSNSAVKSATYIPQLALPTLNPDGGLAASPTTVTITSATAGASLRYTLDGTTPTESYGTLIAASSGSVSVGTTAGGTVLKAIAFKTGWIPSAVTSATYTQPQVAQPTYNPSGGLAASPTTITITTATTGASLRYTLDGTTPTESYGTLIAASSGSVSVATTAGGTVLKAIAFKTGWIPSAVSSATYIMPQVAQPTYNPSGGLAPSPTTVTITTATTGANLRYTLDGTTPTESNGTLIAASSGTVSVATTAGGTVLKAIAFQNGWIPSAVISATYTKPQVAVPALNPNGGEYSSASPVTVTLTTATAGASLRYTLDGTTPTESYGTLIAASSGTVSVTSTAGGTVLKAIAFKNGWIPSAVTSATYIKPQVALAVYNPTGGFAPSPTTVTITTATAGANLRYTLDGTTPTESYGTLIAASSGSVSVTTTAGGIVLKTIAFKNGWITSAVTSATYTKPQVALPNYSPGNGLGSESYPIPVTITTATAGANMRYTLDGTTPTESYGTLIAASSGSVSITTGGTVLKTIAFKTGWITSGVQSSSYTANPVEPPYTPPPISGTDRHGGDSNYMQAGDRKRSDTRMALGASAVSSGATGPKSATMSGRAPGSGSDYLLASYQSGGTTGIASNASAVTPDRTRRTIAARGRTPLTGSNYMLASYETKGDSGAASSANAMTLETTSSNTTTAVSSTTPVNVYLYAGDQIIENVTKGHFYYQDSLGNTSHVSDAVGNLLERYTYSAFGTPSFYTAAGAWRTTSAYGIRHLFQGQLWTQETGLNDYRNRTELPTMGVFLQPDPIGFKGDAANLYRFVNNNAVNRTDPLGLIDTSAESRLTSMGHGDWDWFNGKVAEQQRDQQQAARITFAPLAKEEGPKDGVKVTGGFRDLRPAQDAAAHADYEQIDKSGIGGKDRPEYGGLMLRRKDSEGRPEFGYSGPYKGAQGRVEDKYRKMRQANYLVVHGPGALPVPRGWTKIGWHYAHVIPGNTIPSDDKAVARDHGYVVVGAAPPLRRGAYYSASNPMIEYYP